MKDAEILKKAIEKATKNGWVNTLQWNVLSEDGGYYTTLGYDINKATELLKNHKDGYLEPVIDWNYSWQAVIYEHDFAKAFWKFHQPEKYLQSTYPYRVDYRDAWKHHLQQMVLEKEPLKYLERFL